MFINLCMNQWYKIINKNTDILNIPFLIQLTLFHKYTIQRSRHNTLGESERIRLLVGEGYVCWERKQWRFFPRFFFYNVHRKRGPLMTSYSSQKSSSQVKKNRLEWLQTKPRHHIFHLLQEKCGLGHIETILWHIFAFHYFAIMVWIYPL